MNFIRQLLNKVKEWAKKPVIHHFLGGLNLVAVNLTTIQATKLS